jgi:hypothetical protein
VPRPGNGVAHSLAKMALSVGQEAMWQDDFPFSICDLVRTEQGS